MLKTALGELSYSMTTGNGRATTGSSAVSVIYNNCVEFILFREDARMLAEDYESTWVDKNNLAKLD